MPTVLQSRPPALGKRLNEGEAVEGAFERETKGEVMGEGEEAADEHNLHYGEVCSRFLVAASISLTAHAIDTRWKSGKASATPILTATSVDMATSDGETELATLSSISTKVYGSGRRTRRLQKHV